MGLKCRDRAVYEMNGSLQYFRPHSYQGHGTWNQFVKKKF